MLRRYLQFFAVLFALTATTAHAGTQYTFTTITFPAGPGTSTYASGINDAGQIVGAYYSPDGNLHGFLLSGGTFTTIDYPGAVWTSANGINSDGQIVGSYYTCQVPNGYGCRHPYLLSGGVFTTLPEAPGSMYGTTYPSSINKTGQIAGYYVDPCFCTSHGFLYSGGAYTTVDQPGYSSTGLFGINDLGQVAGNSTQCWGCGGGPGFLLTAGTYTAINVPGTSQTVATAVNNTGDVAGYYYSGPDSHSFVLSGGTFTYLDVPGGIYTTVSAMNSGKRLVGYYLASDGLGHGFLATPAGYNIYLLYDPTKAVKSGSTIPVKLQIRDGSGTNHSSSSIALHAVSVTQASNISGAVQDAGSSNPDSDFRYDATLGGYIFNLKTTGLAAGTYSLNFQIAGAGTYAAPFQVK